MYGLIPALSRVHILLTLMSQAKYMPVKHGGSVKFHTNDVESLEYR